VRPPRPGCSVKLKGVRRQSDAREDDEVDGGGPRAKLLKELRKVAEDVAEAKDEWDDPVERNKHLGKAVKRLRKKVLPRMDGFFGGNPANDWIVTEVHQRLVYPLVKALMNDLGLEEAVIPGPPPIR